MLSFIPDQTHSLEVIEKLLNLNFLIEENLFKKTQFKEKELENSFLIHENNLDEIYKIKSDLMITLGWMSIFFYIYIAYYNLFFIILCCIFTFISLILSVYRYFIKDRKRKLIIDYIHVFLPILYLNFKALYITFCIANKENDNSHEISRTIIYNWIATTLLSFQKLDGSLLIYILFNIINFSATIIIHVFSYHNHYYYLDGITSLAVATGGYIFKKFYEIKIRRYYGVKIKSEKISSFFLGFINGLNGLYLNIKNDDTISYGSKMEREMESLNINDSNKYSFDLDKEKCKMSEDFIYLNTYTELNTPKIFLKSLVLYDIKSIDSENVKSYKYTYSLYDKIQKLQSTDIDSSLNFKNLGIYYIKSTVGYRYYDVYFRKIKLSETNIIYDLVFYKATDLIVSLIKIEEETQHKNQILGKLVHEFKTPLNSILGLIDNINEKEDNDAVVVKHDLNIIKNLSNYVIFLINDIIHYSSRKNYDELNIMMHEINIRKVVIFGFEILNSLLNCNISKCNSINTELEFEDDLYNLSINADETRLKQILLNLISNAVKFTKSGHIIIKCYKHPEKDLILISVADSGSGIKDENQKYIFDDYFMESDGYSNNKQGTGIGLSICKNIAKRMNMDIKFKSILGQGSEFTIEIPITRKNIINICKDEDFKNVSGKENIFQQEDYDSNQTIKKFSDAQNILLPRKNMNFISSNKNLTRDNNNYSRNEGNIKDINILETNLYMSPLKINCKRIPLYRQINEYLSSTNFSILSNNIKNNESKLNNLQNIQILIVDDDKYICNSIKILVKRIFNELNCFIDIITATDGFHIIQKVIEDQRNGNKIKCIITDENMEYLNGSDAINIIKNLEKDNKIRNVKIITATSQEDVQLINYIKKVGADIVISKPLSKSTLTKALQDLHIINI